MTTKDDLNQSLDDLLRALINQIKALVTSTATEPKFDKKIIDDVYTTTRAITKLRELAEQCYDHKTVTSDEDRGTRELLNRVEERIEFLAQQRAKDIVSRRSAAASVGKNIEARVIKPSTDAKASA